MDSVLTGALAALQPVNLLYCTLGCVVGTLIGVLPGIGPVATISLLLPLVIGLDPLSSIIMIAGIYYGAAYGGSITSILVNIPGEASTVVTCLDGYQMARQGRGGVALALAAGGSFVAGTLGTAAIAVLAEPLMRVALRFGPPEYFALMVLGIVLVSFMARGSFIKALTMVMLGLFLSLVGQDVITGEVRFTLDIFELTDGIGLVPLAMGLFGISEVLSNMERIKSNPVVIQPVTSLRPSASELREAAGPVARGSVLGFLLGLLPGGGPTLASFAAYFLEHRLSKHPDRFGRGALAGVAGPEAANNAAASGSFIPLFVLGLPSNAAMALLLGAFTMYGLSPGPQMLSDSRGLFWGVVVSMYVGNVILVVLNLPLIGIWVRLLRAPYAILFPFILLFMLIGTYAMAKNPFDVYLLVGFGVIGYLLRKADYELAPLILAYVLGNQMETAFRQTLLIGRGSFDFLLGRPITLGILGVTLLVLAASLAARVRQSRAALIAKLEED